MYAWMEGRLSEDIVAEQRKVEEAELIIFQVRDPHLSGWSCVAFPFVSSAETQFFTFPAFLKTVNTKLNHQAFSTKNVFLFLFDSVHLVYWENTPASVLRNETVFFCDLF